MLVSRCTAPANPEHSVDKASDSLTLSDEQQKQAGIVTELLQYRSIPDYVEANGQLDVPPQSLITITAPLGGFVKRVPLLEGMRLKKGDLLAELEHPDYIQLQQDYLQAVSQLSWLKLEYQRQEELSRENITALKSLEKVRADYNAAQVQVQALAARLAMLNINPDKLTSEGLQPSVLLWSPIDGFVTRVQANLGEYVPAHRELFRIIDPTHLHAELFVFEKDLPRLRIGQKVVFNLLTDTITRYARIYLIGKELTSDRTVRIHCHLEKNYTELIPGLYIKGIVYTNEHRALAVPADALLYQGDENFLFIRRGKHLFQLIRVKTGKSADGYTEIQSNELSEGVPVVVKGAYTLLSMLRNKGEEDEG